MAQPASVGIPPSLNLGSPALASAPGAPASPLPPGRNLSSLRTPKGTNFIRLAFAAIFLLGFLGVVGFFLKEHVVGMFPALAAYMEPPPEAVIPDAASKVATAPPSPMPEASKVVLTEPAPVIAPSPTPEPTQRPTNLVGFDPGEPASSMTNPVVSEFAPGTSNPPAPAIASESPGMPLDSSAAPREMVRPASTPETAMGSVVSTTPQPLPTSPPSANEPSIKEQAPEEAKDAVQALKQFLQASTVSERLAYTLGADVMKPLMERYYSRTADGPVMVDRIEFVRMDPNPELGSGRHCIFSLENKTWEYPVPVMLEEQPDGFKVDWLAFVEFKDRLLEKFFQNYQEGAARFHVGIIRHHYFEDDVPNLDRKYAFRVSPAPPNIFQASVFLDKESELAQQLRSRLPWENHVWAVVELEWKKLGTQQWVELSAVPQMHWYSLPTTPRPISTSQRTSGSEMPPGISKNGISADGSPPAFPPGISRSSPDLPPTVKRPLPAGR